MVRQHFETMTIRGKADDIGCGNHPNQDIAIEDMTGYIERMGGKLHTTLVEDEWVFYNFIVPSNWVGRMYERFKSFGFKAKVKPQSMWYGVLDEEQERELRDSQNRIEWKIPDPFHFTTYKGEYV